MRPILIDLPFSIPLYAYGAMLCLSVVVGRFLALRLARQSGLDPVTMDRCAMFTIAGALVGARLLFVVTSVDALNGPADAFRFWKGGMVAYGGFLGGFAASAAFCRTNRVSLLAWADSVAPALCVGLTLTRIGCFLAGCDFGRPWNGAIAVRFPAGSPAFRQQMIAGLLSPGATESLPVHPTQLYESAAGLVLLALVIVAWRRRLFVGQTFLAATAAYAVLRFFIEMARADVARGLVGALSTSQFIAVLTFAAASVAYALGRCARGVGLHARTYSIEGELVARRLD